MDSDLEKFESFESDIIILKDISDCLKSGCLSNEIKDEVREYIKKYGITLVWHGPNDRLKEIIKLRKNNEQINAEHVMKFVRDHSENIEKFLKQGIDQSEKMEKYWEEEMTDAKRVKDKEKK